MFSTAKRLVVVLAVPAVQTFVVFETDDQRRNEEGALTWSGAVSNRSLHLWFISGLLDESHQAIRGLLSTEERERADRFLMDIHRRRFISSRIALRFILGRHLHCDAGEITFRTGRWGKPAIANPTEGMDLQFSLSRSKDAVVIGVTRGDEIGVDVEWRDDHPDHSAIADQYFSAPEREVYRVSEDPKRTFFDIWTAKEAYIKATGRGLSHPLSEFDVLAGKENIRKVRDWSQEAPSKALSVLRQDDLSPGYSAAVAGRFGWESIKRFSCSPNELLAIQ